MEITPAIISKIDEDLRCISLNDNFKCIRALLDKERPELLFKYKGKDNGLDIDIEIKYSIPAKFIGAGDIKGIENLIVICKNLKFNNNYKMHNLNISAKKYRAEYYNSQDGTSITISTLRY